MGRGGGKQGSCPLSLQEKKKGAIPKERPRVEAQNLGTVEEDVIPESLSPR